MLPARAIFTPTGLAGVSTKNKHLLLSGQIPTHGFTVALSVFGGTPPAKPLNCKFKIRLARSSPATVRFRAHPVGDQPKLVLAQFSLSPEDITWMSLCLCSQIVHLSLLFVHRQQPPQGKQKPCLLFGKQGLRKSYTSLDSLPAYLLVIQFTFWTLPNGGHG